MLKQTIHYFWDNSCTLPLIYFVSDFLTHILEDLPIVDQKDIFSKINSLRPVKPKFTLATQIVVKGATLNLTQLRQFFSTATSANLIQNW